MPESFNVTSAGKFTAKGNQWPIKIRWIVSVPCQFPSSTQCFIDPLPNPLLCWDTRLPLTILSLFICLSMVPYRCLWQHDGDTPGKWDLLLPLPGLPDKASRGQVRSKRYMEGHPANGFFFYFRPPPQDEERGLIDGLALWLGGWVGRGREVDWWNRSP